MATGSTASGLADPASQRGAVPAIYGEVDFDVVPERVDLGATREDERFQKHRSAIDRVFDRPELLDIARTYSMMGDSVADAYAALIPEHGLAKLIEMLECACERGVEGVPDAPPELAAFILAMEATPDWVDMDLVRAGARSERVPMATATPLAIRGAFLATFLNKYAALPMAMTGTLSDEAARKRVFETASFFTATTLPGALERHGKGFEAAAKVRLMHSMVRFHLLRSDRWDVATYGIPIPQIDQMPAGTISTFLMSAQLLRKGHTEFTDDQRATVELSRYRCFLLGLPQVLLGETPSEIVDLLTARHIVLTEGYDEEICGSLVQGTLGVELFDTSNVKGRVHAWLEDGFSRAVLINAFLAGDTKQAAAMGLTSSGPQKVAATIALASIIAGSNAYKVGLRLPVVSAAVDRRLNQRLADLLDSYGHADFVTDPDRYAIAAG